MQLGAVAQSRFPAFGRMINPGDRIEPEELGKLSPQVRDAWVSLKYIVLDGSEGGSDSDPERFQRLEARVDALHDKVDALLEALGQPVAPKPAAKPAKAKV